MSEVGNNRSAALRMAALCFVAAGVCLLAACAAHTVKVPLIRHVDNDKLRLYVAHAERDWPGITQQQDMTVDTLNCLIDAAASLATTKGAASPGLTQRLNSLRTSTRTFAAGTAGTAHQAAVLRETFDAAVSLIGSLLAATSAEDGGGRVKALERSASAVDAAQPLPAQADAIEQFFQEAAAALERVDAVGRGY